MGMETAGWIALGWFAVALVTSLILGGFLRKVSEAPGEDEFATAASRQKVMRYMRNRKLANVRANVAAPRVREQGKRSTG